MRVEIEPTQHVMVTKSM